MKFTDDMIISYEAPLSDTEDGKCKRAIGMIRDALKGLGYEDGPAGITRSYADIYDYSLTMRNKETSAEIRLFIQGSYANNTNVRQESDVDVAVILESTFMADYPANVTRDTYGFTAGSMNVITFKDKVEQALKTYFLTGVERKNKSIKINGNSSRVDADTVPAMRNKDFRNDTYLRQSSVNGIYIRADDGTTVVNYPEQHIVNGRIKNNDTNYYFKKMVRVLKKMRYIMQNEGHKSADNISSFALESLLWNIPNSIYLDYSKYSHSYMFGLLMDYVLKNFVSFNVYKEANGIKPLFQTGNDAENMKSFIRELIVFYEY